MENKVNNNGKPQNPKDAMPELEPAKAEAELPAPGQETKPAGEEMLELEPADPESVADKATDAVKQAASAATATATAKAKDVASDVKEAAADAAAKAKDAASSVKSAVTDNIPQVNIPAPEHKSGIAWLWWILAVVFIAIIVCCIYRSDNGTKNLKEEGTDSAKTTAVTNVKSGVNQTAKALAITAASTAKKH